MIIDSYKIDNSDLKILEVEAKLGEHEGVYYRMTIRDGNRKTYKIKIEKPKPQDAWSMKYVISVHIFKSIILFE